MKKMRKRLSRLQRDSRVRGIGVGSGALVALTLFAAGAETLTLPLWPGGAPSRMPAKSEATAKLIASYGGATATRVTDVTEPTLTIHRPLKPNGTSVIVAPGGGYMFLSVSFEGTEVCEWLRGIGVTAVLLQYRTPTRDAAEPFAVPVEDGRRALALVRQHAPEWNLDPRRVGMLGFSAGANLAGHCAWDREPRAGGENPPAGVPDGPDFLVFIYGGGFLEPDAPGSENGSWKFRKGFSVPADAPPAFFLVAHDDKSAPVESAMLYLEYQRRKLPAELHIYGRGGHGFGMRRNGLPVNDWPARCEEWMRAQGLLAAPGAPKSPH